MRRCVCNNNTLLLSASLSATRDETHTQTYREMMYISTGDCATYSHHWLSVPCLHLLVLEDLLLSALNLNRKNWLHQTKKKKTLLTYFIS